MTEDTDASNDELPLDDLLAELSALLFHHDPFGISFTEDSGEYAPVAQRLVPFLDGCLSAEEVAAGLRAIAESLAVDLPTEGDAIQAAATEIWALIGP